MPYIKKTARTSLDPHIEAVIDALAKEVDSESTSCLSGYLNYTVTRIVLGSWLKAAEHEKFLIGYADIAEMKSSLREAADELSRRILGAYEDKCIKKNGDVKEYKKIKNFLK